MSDQTRTSSFRYADRRVGDLLKKLKGRGVCGHCTGQALLLHAVWVCEETMGSTAAIELCEELIEIMREHNAPAPDHDAIH